MTITVLYKFSSKQKILAVLKNRGCFKVDTI